MLPKYAKAKWMKMLEAGELSLDDVRRLNLTQDNLLETTSELRPVLKSYAAQKKGLSPEEIKAAGREVSPDWRKVTGPSGEEEWVYRPRADGGFLIQPRPVPKEIKEKFPEVVSPGFKLNQEDERLSDLIAKEFQDLQPSKVSPPKIKLETPEPASEPTKFNPSLKKKLLITAGVGVPMVASLPIGVSIAQKLRKEKEEGDQQSSMKKLSVGQRQMKRIIEAASEMMDQVPPGMKNTDALVDSLYSATRRPEKAIAQMVEDNPQFDMLSRTREMLEPRHVRFGSVFDPIETNRIERRAIAEEARKLPPEERKEFLKQKAKFYLSEPARPPNMDPRKVEQFKPIGDITRSTTPEEAGVLDNILWRGEKKRLSDSAEITDETPVWGSPMPGVSGGYVEGDPYQKLRAYDIAGVDPKDISPPSKHMAFDTRGMSPEELGDIPMHRGKGVVSASHNPLFERVVTKGALPEPSAEYRVLDPRKGLWQRVRGKSPMVSKEGSDMDAVAELVEKLAGCPSHPKKNLKPKGKTSLERFIDSRKGSKQRKQEKMKKEAISASDLKAAAKRLNPQAIPDDALKAFGAFATPTPAQTRHVAKTGLPEWQKGLLPEEMETALGDLSQRSPGSIFVEPGAGKILSPTAEGETLDQLGQMATLHEGLELGVKPREIQHAALHLSPKVPAQELNMINRADPDIADAAERLRALREAGGEHDLLRSQLTEQFGDRAAEFMESGRKIPKAMLKRLSLGSRPELSLAQAQSMMQGTQGHIVREMMANAKRVTTKPSKNLRTSEQVMGIDDPNIPDDVRAALHGQRKTAADEKKPVKKLTRKEHYVIKKQLKEQEKKRKADKDLEKLVGSKPTPAQLARYSAIGGAVGGALHPLGTVVEGVPKGKSLAREALGARKIGRNIVSGAAFAAMTPMAKYHVDRYAAKKGKY